MKPRIGPMPLAHRLARVFCLCAALCGLSACGTLGYYAQAARGQMDILARREPIAQLLAGPALEAGLRARLESVRRIRAFALRELALPDNGSYTAYADLERRFAVWAVFATPEFSLAPVDSCFPLVGCVAYRGYFAEAEARAYADARRAEGLDVYVAGVPAYSTLGWFADPVLNTMLDWPEPYLAGLLFHELAHQVLYVPGDTVFNESFASAVEEAGVRRWLALGQSQAEQAEAYRVLRARETTVIDLAQDAYRRLADLYREDWPAATLRARKRAVFADLRARYAEHKAGWDGYAEYDAWFAEDLNNAKLVTVMTYRDQVPGFLALLAEKGGDFAAFYQAVRELAGLAEAKRRARLREWAARREGP